MKKSTGKRPLIVLLDAHAIIHRAYHAMPDFATRDGRPTGAIYGFGMMVLNIIAQFKPDHIIACYDLPGKTFRHESYSEYKSGRGETDDALKLQFNPTREICEAFAIPIYDAPGFEADDILGTIGTQMKNEAVDFMIASGDMDTLQLIDGDRIRVYTLKKGITDTVVYDEQAVVDRYGFAPLSVIDYKALRGDPSDNIPGIKGIGDKAATIAIKEFATIEKMYAELDKGESADEKFLELGLTKRMIGLIREGREEAEFSKVIATIRHDAPIEFTIPEHSWKDAVDVDRAMEIFEKYELRTLPNKLRIGLGLDTVSPQAKTETEKPVEDINPEEFHKTAIALCLLDSDKTDASLDDILEHTRATSFQDAQKMIMKELQANERSHKIFEYIEKPLIPVVLAMQQAGVSVDKDFFAKLSKQYHKELDILATKIYKHAGREFNIKSPKQLSEILFVDMELSTKGIKKSKTGAYSTNVKVLEKLHDEHEIIQLIMEYRELEKLLSTYIDVIPDMVSDDGRLHAEFLQNGTVTGRFSSRNPNMQNIPTRTDLGRKIREGFVAAPGHALVSFDYSQIELRCLAILSGDPALIKIFQEGQDIHTAVAALIGGVDPADVDRDMRRKAKIVNFGILYGMGINSLKKQMGADRAEAQIFYDGFFSQFPKAAQYLEDTKEFARENGYTETLFGRRRQFRNINSKLGFIRAMAERMALNAPIQGTAADLIKLAMVQAHKRISSEYKGDQARLVLQVHDEIIYEVEEKLVAEFSQKLVEIMEKVLEDSYLKYDSPVPLVVHSSHGAHWGLLK